MKGIFKKTAKVIGISFLICVSVTIGFLVYFNLPVYSVNNSARLGVTFSARYAGDIGLDWKEALIAALDDLGVKKIRIPVYWDLAESQEGQYNFADIDWQLEQARLRDTDVILVLGQKVPRWPECFIPGWVKNDDRERNIKLLKFLDVAVKRYRDGHPEIKYWQVENEPFLPFGECPNGTISEEDLDAELALVKWLDPTRQIIVTDSGELGLWYKAAVRADIFGTTMYRTVWKEGLGYYDYPVGPRFFWFKHWLIKTFARQSKVIIVELQGEPWINGWTTSGALSEQFKSMDAQKLQDNVIFAKKTGFPEIYLWGVEWWHWLKIKKGHPELWDMAKFLFASAPITSSE